MKKKNNQMDINVAGMSVSDILNLDYIEISKMNLTNLKKITSRLVSAGNKRIRRLRKYSIRDEMTPPALRVIEQMGRDFSVKQDKNLSKDKQIANIRHEFYTLKKFLGYKTSTIQGWKKEKKRIEKMLKLPSRDQKKFWEIYNSLSTEEAGVVNELTKSRQYDSTRIQEYIYTLMVDERKKKYKDRDYDSILERVRDKIDVEYEKLKMRQQEIFDMDEDDEDDGTSVFTFDENF